MADTEAFDIVAEFNALLIEAGSIWDVIDRQDGNRTTITFLTEHEARVICEEWNWQEGRERFKVVKRRD
ncbi:hypothetical protein [Methylobacterium nodulans]|uniref:Uncharacterized protein n=1 Tax=Methylobacterium nodulans (strain LMG 21967 / CNCM I-2342 / ORS 2060) TaxID=460265 RepID=B8IXT2_METNO|nr:hypothetical protein [Methylobacterium nodulans]ACL63222.1 conserved hypothetical protein [Methylobacterium nodulans ORS 2060]